jgi:hypothetical protein
MPRIPYFPDNRLTDGGENVSLSRWPRFTSPPMKISGTHFFYSLSTSRGHWEVGRNGQIGKKNYYTYFCLFIYSSFT